MFELRRIARRRDLYLLRAIFPAVGLPLILGYPLGETGRMVFGWVVLIEFVLLALVTATSLGAWRMRQEHRTGGLELRTIAGEPIGSILLRTGLSASILSGAICLATVPVLAAFGFLGGISISNVLQVTALLAASILFCSILGAAILLFIPSYRWGLSIGYALLGGVGVLWPIRLVLQGESLLTMASWHPGAALYVAVADPFLLGRVGGVHVPALWLLGASVCLVPLAWIGHILAERIPVSRRQRAIPFPPLGRFLPPLDQDARGWELTMLRGVLPPGSPRFLAFLILIGAGLVAVVWHPWADPEMVMGDLLAGEMAILLAVAVITASTAFAREKDRGTFSVILCAPVGAREALFATKVGLTLRLAYLLMLPVGHAALLVVNGDLGPRLFLMILVVEGISFWVCLNVGLLASVWARTAVRAVIIGFGILVGLTLLLPLLHPALLLSALVVFLFILGWKFSGPYYRTRSCTTGCLALFFLGSLFGMGCILTPIALVALASAPFQAAWERILGLSPVYLVSQAPMIQTFPWAFGAYVSDWGACAVMYLLAGILLGWWVPRRFDDWTGRGE